MSKADNALKNRLLMKDAEEARDSITKNQQREIKKLYSDWAKEVGERAEYFKNKTTPSSVLAEQQLRILQSQMIETSRQVSNELNGKIKNNMYLVSEAVVKSNSRWLGELGFKNSSAINAAFTNVPDMQVRRLITGQLYDSGWSLSKAIWTDNEKALKDVYSIVAEGLAKNTPIYDIAKNLEAYVNPNRRLDWNLMMKDGRRIYKKSVDYNAQRLARTLVQHSYQASFVAVTKNNPLITSYRWIANGSRVCPLCMEMDGRIFEKDDLPLDHPNGMCTIEPVIDENYLDRLANWVVNPDGSDPELDEFAKNFGYVPENKESVQINNNSVNHVVQGKDISGTWIRRPDQFDFEIEDVINAQGFDGLPRVVSKEEFEKAVAEANGGNGFIAQRTYSAPNQEVLDAYRDQLYNGKWYVDCSTGGAQYGQGMYCAADYTGMLSDGIKAEIEHYKELGEGRYAANLSAERYKAIQKAGNNLSEALRISNMSDEEFAREFGLSNKAVSYTETFTLDPSAKGVTWREINDIRLGNIDYDSFRKENTSDILKNMNLSENESTFVRYNLGQGVTWKEVNVAAKAIGKDGQDKMMEVVENIGNELQNRYNIEHEKRIELARIYQEKYHDIGSLASALGYDYINAEGHGQSESYTVILNRTKVIFKGE